MEDGTKKGLVIGLIVALLLVIVYQNATLIDNYYCEEDEQPIPGGPEVFIYELPEGNLFQTLAPMYSDCYSRDRFYGNIHEEDILCCAKPLANVSEVESTFDKELVICDRLEFDESTDKLLIIRD